MKNCFKGIHTLEELKKAYRKLALEHHPAKSIVPHSHLLREG